MTTATLDRLLAVLVVAAAATGLLTLRAGEPSLAWLFTLHAVLAATLGVATAEKVRRSLPKAIAARRWIRLFVGGAVTLVAAAAVVGGLTWVASGELLSIGRWTVLTLHAWAGLILVPLLVIHLVPRRWRLLRPPAGRPSGGDRGIGIGRRTALVGGGMALAAIALVGLTGVIERLRGGERRFTGSRWLPAGGIPPPTTFFGEPAPAIDPARWRLTVRGAVDRPAVLAMADLARLGETDLTAVLDCTSGWALETGWRGVPLATVLDAAGVAAAADRVIVRSATGWSAFLPLAEARRCLLATAVAGQPLAVGNGAPLRLVVPDRRGLDWVKWVVEIEVA